LAGDEARVGIFQVDGRRRAEGAFAHGVAVTRSVIPRPAMAFRRRPDESLVHDRTMRFFEMLFGGTRNQVVARLLYRDALREQLEGAFGFTVNLDWVRRFDFPDVTRQVSRMGEAGSGLALAVLDNRGARVAGTSAEALPEPTTTSRSRSTSRS
jgi:hypothetical protein